MRDEEGQKKGAEESDEEVSSRSFGPQAVSSGVHHAPRFYFLGLFLATNH
jgi:hypothetical protein